MLTLDDLEGEVGAEIVFDEGGGTGGSGAGTASG